MKISNSGKLAGRYLNGLLIFTVVLVIAFYVSENWFQIVLVHGESMSPTYHDLQFALLDKCSEEYTYGDIIVFECDELESVLIKRIVACPKDVVDIKDGKLYVNNEVSNYIDKGKKIEYAGIAENSIKLGNNEYFVIGDNIEKSKDSRYGEIGPVKSEDILGIIKGR